MTPRTDYERQIVDCVEKYGNFVLSVFGAEDGSSPPFSYSIGFAKTLGAPEVIVQGLPSGTAHPVINDLFSMCTDGLQLSDGLRIDGLLANYPCVARGVDESWITQSYFASALWYHRTQMNSALTDVVQLVWPDADGRFPWEEGCADWVRSDQPVMYEPRRIQ
jgi:hypothetical protein